MGFRKLEDDFLKELKDVKGKLHYILDYERKHRKSFMVEIRDNFLDIYFLGHSIEVRKRKDGYKLIASKEFNPKELLKIVPANIVKLYGKSKSKWWISLDDIKGYDWFEEIMNAIIAKIMLYEEGTISEGISELNHFIYNRAIGKNVGKNGILVIDKQIAYPKNKKDRIDLLGIKRMLSGKFTFTVIELKNKNNKDIADVFTKQLKRYIDFVYEKYEYFVETYKTVIEQKIALGLLRAVKCEFPSRNEIKKKDIEGIAILDNYNVRSDFKENGLLSRALRDWSNVGEEYTMKLFLKTNILDSTFFLDRNKAEKLLNEYKSCNL